jgi:hypothetical protein
VNFLKRSKFFANVFTNGMDIRFLKEISFNMKEGFMLQHEKTKLGRAAIPLLYFLFNVLTDRFNQAIKIATVMVVGYDFNSSGYSVYFYSLIYQGEGDLTA